MNLNGFTQHEPLRHLLLEVTELYRFTPDQAHKAVKALWDKKLMSPRPYASCTIWFSTAHASRNCASGSRFIGCGAASRIRQSKDSGWWHRT